MHFAFGYGEFDLKWVEGNSSHTKLSFKPYEFHNASGGGVQILSRIIVYCGWYYIITSSG